MRLIDRLRACGTIREGPLACNRCGAEFTKSCMRLSRLGDPVCPRCGSVDIAHRATRPERLRSFLIDYNTY
jgi:DNA-directed RNA polymerase subunit RPC12/RpoP